MSPEFNYYITNGMYVSFAMVGIMAIGFFINVILACVIKSFIRFAIYAFANSFIIALVYLLIFFTYWYNLTSNVNNAADQKWVNGHDGGIILIFFKIIVSSLASLTISAFIYVALNLIRRIYKKPAQQLDSSEPASPAR